MKVLLCLVLAIGVVGCVDNRGGTGGGSCASTCRQRAEACGGSGDSCASTCETASALADRVDCRAEYDAVQACLAANPRACGTDIDILCSDQSEVLAACSRAFCGVDPTDAFCVQACVEICEQISFNCGVTSDDCEPFCQQTTEALAETGCGAEYFERVSCQAEQRACTLEEADLLCAAEAEAHYACFDRFCAANPSHSSCSG